MIKDPDDVSLIKQSVLRETLLKVLDLDKKTIETSPIRIKEPYIIAIDDAVSKAIQDAADIKTRLIKRGVKILQSETTEYGVKVKYVARGYESEVEFWGGNMRAEVWILLDKYVFGKEKKNSESN